MVARSTDSDEPWTYRGKVTWGLEWPHIWDTSATLTPTASALLATQLIRTCQDLYPDVSLALFEGLSEEVMRRLSDNSLDMGFSYNPGAAKGVATEPLLTEALFLVGAPGAEDPGEKVSFREVCKRALILPSRGFGLRDCVENAARDAETVLEIAFEIDSVATQRDLAESGLGFTILPYAAVRQSVEAGGLFAAQITRPQISRTLNIAYAASHSANKATNAVRHVIDRVVSESIAESGGRLHKA